jgi:hypothetical protein
MTYSIEERSEDVQETLEEHPVQTHPFIEAVVSVDGNGLADGQHARDTQPDKHQGSVRSPSRHAKLVDPADKAACGAQRAYLLPGGVVVSLENSFSYKLAH